MNIYRVYVCRRHITFILDLILELWILALLVAQVNLTAQVSLPVHLSSNITSQLNPFLTSFYLSIICQLYSRNDLHWFHLIPPLFFISLH